jgi:acyl-CoA synthetase (NDP forming)
MIKTLEESPLYPVANPKSVTFFGASNSIAAMGTNLLLSLQAAGFEGKIYPVHYKEDKVLGLAAYKNVMELPEVPDLAVMVLPTRIVNPTLEMCGKKGIRRVVIVSGGFKEVGGEGVALEKELIEIAGRYSIRVLGPNCLGVANPHHRVNTTFIPYEGPGGFIGLASQSGSFVTQLFDYLSGMGVGFSTAFSVGNESDIDLVDAMEYLAVCPHTKVIALYIEGIRRGRAFVEAARSIVRHKPVVAFYVGGSETGRQAGFSHTGALAGPDELYDGMFRQSGVIRARSVTELFDFCWVLGSSPLPRGRRVVIQTHSGGPGAAAADACGRSGLELPALSDNTVERLAPFVPHTGSVSNPVDLTFTKNPTEFYSSIPEILLQEERADTLLVYFLTPMPVIKRGLAQMGLPPEQIAEQALKLIDEQCRNFSRLAQASDKPVVGYTFRSLDDPSIRGLTERGMPVFLGPERAARAIAALLHYAGR